MRSVRFTKAEVAAVMHAMEECVTLGQGYKRKDAESAEAKLRAASEERRAPVQVGTSVAAAVSVMERVLGAGTVALPPHADSGWYGRVGATVKRGQYTTVDFAAAAEAIRAKGWAPPYSFERTVYAMDRLLAEHAARGGGLPPGVLRGRPIDMDDL